MKQKDIPTLVAIHVEDTAARYASFSSANMLYHYTSIDIISKIIRGRKVCLRMTREDCFEDKQEGKLITEFYQIALERLYAAGKIDIAQYAYLKNVKMPTDDRALYKDEDGQMIHGKTSGVDYYVSCFSLNREDPYMYNAYISRPDKKGCCIGFHPKCWETEERLAGWYNDGCRLETLRVLYGEDAIHCIEDLLIRLLGLEELSMQDIETRIASIISDKLKRMRLCMRCLIDVQKTFKDPYEVIFLFSRGSGNDGLLAECDMKRETCYEHEIKEEIANRLGRLAYLTAMGAIKDDDAIWGR